MSGLSVDLPQFILNGDFEKQTSYFELQELILTQWFNSNGFFNPTLTSTQVTALLALPNPPPTGTRWFNTTLNKEQFIGNGGVVQTITSV